MGWDFWDKRDTYQSRNKNQKLYRNPFTGNLETTRQDTSAESYRRGWNSNKCTNSDDCGSGYSCIDGQCVKIWTSDGSDFKPATCGNDNVTWAPCNKSATSGGSYNQCSTATPGNCDPDPICPGEKCCRQRADGSIRCVCGSCEQTDTSVCNVWCDQNYKTFGEVGAGCFKSDQEGYGECGGNICDECEFCDDNVFGAGGFCVKQSDTNAPCWCSSNNTCPNECNKCDKDPNSSSYGDCYYDPDNCQQCCIQYNYICPQCPNKMIEFGTHCQPINSTIPCITVLRDKLNKQCAEACATEPDPCAPDCVTTTVYAESPADPACPDGYTSTGLMTVGTTSARFCESCDYSAVPDFCKECDCNCHNDCPDCQLCGSDGKCYADPVCAATNKVIKLYKRQVGPSLYCGVAGQVCDQIDIETMVWQSSQIAASTEVTLTQEDWVITDTWSGRCNSECAGLGDSCSKPRAVARVYFDGVFAQANTASRCIYANFGDGARWSDISVSYRFEVIYITP